MVDPRLHGLFPLRENLAPKIPLPEDVSAVASQTENTNPVDQNVPDPRPDVLDVEGDASDPIPDTIDLPKNLGFSEPRWVLNFSPAIRKRVPGAEKTRFDSQVQAVSSSDQLIPKAPTEDPRPENNTVPVPSDDSQTGFPAQDADDEELKSVSTPEPPSPKPVSEDEYDSPPSPPRKRSCKRGKYINSFDENGKAVWSLKSSKNAYLP
ncbi:fibronectin-binding protein A [Colletotrichum tofieldiae]|nr:fibronectin-binding protein A [Colletotrichum tofieldiae]